MKGAPSGPMIWPPETWKAPVPPADELDGHGVCAVVAAAAVVPAGTAGCVPGEAVAAAGMAAWPGGVGEEIQYWPLPESANQPLPVASSP
jgi:hypothetical protein